MTGQMAGTVSLVGAGPGDPGLLTVRGLERIRSAEVLVYDNLVSEEILAWAAPHCKRVFAGKSAGQCIMPQEQIGALLVDYARQGLRVVRLKGGDIFLFGRGGEECSVLRENGIPFELVPGVSSAFSVPAYAGIPVTDRRVSSSVLVLTAHGSMAESIGRFATAADTLVILMGTRTFQDTAQALIDHGRPPETPAAIIHAGTTSRQKVSVGTLEDLPWRSEHYTTPSLIVVGEVVRFNDAFQWFVPPTLSGLRILNTRPKQRAAGIEKQILERGGKVESFPLLECTPAEVSNRPEVQERVDQADWLILTSKNAVDALVRMGIEIRSEHCLAVVGRGTRDHCLAQGWNVTVVAKSGNAESLVETLLETIPSMDGLRFEFLRGEKSLATVEKVLHETGATVSSTVVYHQEPLSPEDSEKLAMILARDPIDVAIVTSPLAAKTWLGIRGALHIPTVCLSRKVADILLEAGGTVAGVARYPGNDELVEALENWGAGRLR